MKSPAYATVNYYAGNTDEVLKQPLPESSRNLFLHKRMAVAKDWAEFLKNSTRAPAGEEFDM